MSDFAAIPDPIPLATHWEMVPLITAGLLALVGVFVAYHGYRGYVRNRNRTLLFLTVGILLLTTAPFVVESGIQLINAFTLSQRILASQLLNVLGLIIIIYAFTQT